MLEHTVVQILEGPKQIITDEECCWQVKVMVECYGFKSEETFKFTQKSSAYSVVVGYTYLA